MSAKTLITVEKFAPRLVDALLRRVGYEIHDTGERKPADAPDNLDAPLTVNDTVEGTVGGVTLRHSAYTWLAMHKPVRSTLGTLVGPLARPLTGRRPGSSRAGDAATAAARRAMPPHRRGTLPTSERLAPADRGTFGPAMPHGVQPRPSDPGRQLAGADVATIADQTLEHLGGRTSILARQRADHARLDRLMARARDDRAGGRYRAPGGAARRRPARVHPCLRRGGRAVPGRAAGRCPRATR